MRFFTLRCILLSSIGRRWVYGLTLFYCGFRRCRSAVLGFVVRDKGAAKPRLLLQDFILLPTFVRSNGNATGVNYQDRLSLLQVNSCDFRDHLFTSRHGCCIALTSPHCVSSQRDVSVY